MLSVEWPEKAQELHKDELEWQKSQNLAMWMMAASWDKIGNKSDVLELYSRILYMNPGREWRTENSVVGLSLQDLRNRIGMAINVNRLTTKKWLKQKAEGFFLECQYVTRKHLQKDEVERG